VKSSVNKYVCVILCPLCSVLLNASQSQIRHKYFPLIPDQYFSAINRTEDNGFHMFF